MIPLNACIPEVWRACFGCMGWCHLLMFYTTLCPCPVQYPAENAYQEFLSQHGGTSNAFTAADRACYFFDVSHQYLRGALDRCMCCVCVLCVHWATVCLWKL